ncbi:PHP domain-containing protein [Clostridioides difficile]
MLVDLHIHTYYSDGTMSPKEVVKDAKEKNLGIIAITDHDVLDSYEEFKKEAEKEGIIAIRGVEIDSIFEGNLVHLLAYKFSDNKRFFDLVNSAKEKLLETSVELIKRMENDYDNISLEDYNSYEYDRKKGGWKGIHYLLERNITEGLFDGMKYYGKYECGHEKFNFPSVKEVCDVTHEAGGYVVLAHPCNYYKDKTREEILEKFEILKGLGIDGIECYYPANSELMTETALEFCNKNNLIITAGSDGHGDFGAVSKGVEYYIGAINKDSSVLNINKLL